MKHVRINALSIAKLMVAIRDDALTTYDLAELTGLHPCTVKRYLRALRKEGGCFIERYDPDSLGRPQVMAFRFGAGKDARRPVVQKSSARRKREFYARKRARKEQMRVLQAIAGVQA